MNRLVPIFFFLLPIIAFPANALEGKDIIKYLVNLPNPPKDAYRFNTNISGLTGPNNGGLVFSSLLIERRLPDPPPSDFFTLCFDAITSDEKSLLPSSIDCTFTQKDGDKSYNLYLDVRKTVKNAINLSNSFWYKKVDNKPDEITGKEIKNLSLARILDGNSPDGELGITYNNFLSGPTEVLRIRNLRYTLTPTPLFNEDPNNSAAVFDNLSFIGSLTLGVGNYDLAPGAEVAIPVPGLTANNFLSVSYYIDDLDGGYRKGAFFQTPTPASFPGVIYAFKISRDIRRRIKSGKLQKTC